MPETARKSTRKSAGKSAPVARKGAARPKKAGKLTKGRIAVAEPAGNLQARSAWFAKRRRAS